MIREYRYGTPFETEALVEKAEAATGAFPYGTVDTKNGFSFTYTMGKDDIVYGLGEANRGINKRGYCYISWCSDDPEHTEDKRSLYGAHNFIILSGKQTFGLFFDYPGKLTFDITYTCVDTLQVSCEDADLKVYVIEGDFGCDIGRQFRHAIGRSYIPPKFAFGFGQSRWGYTTKEDFREVAEGYRKNGIPIDMIYMDIDYMEQYKDFTVNKENFPDFPAFVQEMKDQNIRLIPIIDAGVKVEPGYPVYEEGVEKRYFCQREDGSDFVAAVWPGDTHFPDVLNADARKWFGEKYKVLIDQGIEGFWNDMNEPAIFYTTEGKEEARKLAKEFGADTEGEIPVGTLQQAFQKLGNNPKDYQRFYHNVNGERIRHDKVHNLFGYNMTRAASEGFDQIDPDRSYFSCSPDRLMLECTAMAASGPAITNPGGLTFF